MLVHTRAIPGVRFHCTCPAQVPIRPSIKALFGMQSFDVLQFVAILLVASPPPWEMFEWTDSPTC